VFGPPSEKVSELAYNMDEDDDPMLSYLRFLDYRYVRFCYNPLLDKFLLNNKWKDPLWNDVKAIRRGVDGEQYEQRASVFGRNVIDIEEKTVMQLLVDEVSFSFFQEFDLSSIM